MIIKDSQDSLIPLTKNHFEQIKAITADLSKNQLAWLSGYFWGIISQPSSTAHKDLRTHITIISASQTGNARQIAEQLKENLLANNLKVNLFNASNYNFKKISNEKILIIITSTYGNGEPPEEAILFYNFLMSQKVNNLNNLFFAVFGLGDQSYEFFSKTGKDFDNRLEELGAKRLIDRVDADTDYTNQACSWRKEITEILLTKFIHLADSNQEHYLAKNSNRAHKLYTKTAPLTAYISMNQKITGRNSRKDIRHIEIDTKDSVIEYHPGDALGIWYENDDNLVTELISLMHLQEEPVKINDETISIRKALQKYVELTINTSNIVSQYASISGNQELLKIVENKITLQNYAQNYPIIDMLRQAPAKITANQLIKLLRPLKPRLYSISSAQCEVEHEIHITVSIVKYQINKRIHLGGASNYLANRLQNDQIKIFIEPNNNFRLPVDNNIPIIMICSGTGIAPFRSFMQQRNFNGAKGKNWLFFGNQCFTEDFLYQVEWQNYVKNKLLTYLDLAWSQDQKEKIYVQNIMRNKGRILWIWIQENAHIYICGNHNMAKGVEQVLLEIIAHYGKMDGETANNFLNELRVNKRYQRDIY